MLSGPCSQECLKQGTLPLHIYSAPWKGDSEASSVRVYFWGTTQSKETHTQICPGRSFVKNSCSIIFKLAYWWTQKHSSRGLQILLTFKLKPRKAVKIFGKLCYL